MGSPLELTMANSPWNTAEWLIVETNPANQTENDWGSSGWQGFPTIPLVDLSNMETVVKDCWNASSYVACVQPYL